MKSQINTVNPANATVWHFKQARPRRSWQEGAEAVIFSDMSITAIVEEGVIRLPKEVSWASGTVVRIEPVVEELPTLFETLKDFDGIADDLPADLAANLDHYVHAHPRR